MGLDSSAIQIDAGGSEGSWNSAGFQDILENQNPGSDVNKT